MKDIEMYILAEFVMYTLCWN